MGSICSCFKKNNMETSLLNNIMYCTKCGKTFSYNNYYKYIVKCNQVHNYGSL